jgi:1,4-dihydroxy-2-naphthoate polyprenyltransferase
MVPVKSWLQEVRPQFLLSSFVSVVVGVSLATYEGFTFKVLDAVLATAGAVVTQIGIHAFNDYSDYMTGIDLRVSRTPFSGGSGVLPSRKLQPADVYYFGMACLVFVICIGIYFVMTVGLLLLPLGLLGIAVVYSYTSHLTRIGCGELGCAVGFAFWSIGPYFVLTGRYSISILLVSLISALMGVALLLLNEFPDLEADRMGGRRNIPIILGIRRASWIYSFLVAMTYALIVFLPAVKILPIYSLLPLITLPIGMKVVTLVRVDWKNNQMRALKLNVIMVIAVPSLLSLGTVIRTFG